MPVRNVSATIDQAVRSILEQTFADWELIAIDDGSTDDTRMLLERYRDSRIRLIAGDKPLGLPTRLNQAIQIARGTWFARMDGDDISYPRRLERQFAYLQRHQSVALVGCSLLIFGEKGQPIGKRVMPATHHLITKRPQAGFPLPHVTFLGRLDLFQRIKYRPDAIRCEDQDFLLRSYRQALFGNIPEVLMGVREERLNLPKLIASRRHLSKAIWRQLRSEGRLGRAIQGVSEQMIKGGIDGVAIASGLNYKLLRQRAAPITASELATWTEVWSKVQ